MKIVVVITLLLSLLATTGCTELLGALLAINQQRMNQQYVNSAVRYNNAAASYLNRK